LHFGAWGHLNRYTGKLIIIIWLSRMNHAIQNDQEKLIKGLKFKCLYEHSQAIIQPTNVYEF
jgi:hypothetical protein